MEKRKFSQTLRGLPKVPEPPQPQTAEIPGIIKVAINPLSGSILIEYDPQILPTEELLKIGRQELAKNNIKLELPEPLILY